MTKPTLADVFTIATSFDLVLTYLDNLTIETLRTDIFPESHIVDSYLHEHMTRLRSDDGYFRFWRHLDRHCQILVTIAARKLYERGAINV